MFRGTAPVRSGMFTGRAPCQVRCVDGGQPPSGSVCLGGQPPVRPGMFTRRAPRQVGCVFWGERHDPRLLSGSLSWYPDVTCCIQRHIYRHPPASQGGNIGIPSVVFN